MSKKVIVKKDQPKINDGGHKPFGVDLDPNNDLCHVTNKEDGSCKAYYKGSKMKYDDYISELENRVDRNSKGKSITTQSIGTFSGWGEGKLKKPYQS
jgi:hypothetical protein